MTLIDEIIAPFSFQKFSTEYLLQKPVSGRFSTKTVRDKFNWRVACEILDSEYDNCWLAKNGVLAISSKRQQGSVTMEEFCRGQIDGYSLVVRHAEIAHINFAEIAGDFAEKFDCPIDVQLYATPQNQEGFGWHFDYEDVFVMQSFGQKEFFLRENTKWNKKPGADQPALFESEIFKEELSFVLQPGDWLYIPAGWWHKAHAHSPSYHISVGLLLQR